ncbi:MAG: GGDEF domain-containing protein, partial [Actinomycetota bacterium]
MRRGVFAGFATTAVLAVVVTALSLLASARLETNHDRVAVIEAQRLDLLELQVQVAALGAESDPEVAAVDRVALRRTMDRIIDRQVDLLLIDPDLADTQVTLPDGDVVVFGTGLVAAVDAVVEAVDILATADELDGFLILVVPAGEAVDTALATIDAVAEPLAMRSEVAGAAVGSTSRLIAIVGGGLGLGFLVTGFVRMIVLGRPLVTRLAAEHEAYATAEHNHAQDAIRRELTNRLAEGLETAETEAGVLAVVERSLSKIIPNNPGELLLADSSKAHLRSVVTNPGFSKPGCGVTSPWSCPAVRRASTLHYEDSTSLRACPHLADRGEMSSICVPVSFMGDAMGVLHVTGEVGWDPPSLHVEALEIIAGQSAVRLGSIRSFMKAEIQANTDVLTGLANRRATEDHIGASMAARERSSIAIADLDKFKQLNDTHGHEAGDRALRMFAEVLRESVREDDWAGRWGGEEFVIHLPGLVAAEATSVLERIRENLAAACARTDGPNVTVSIGVVDTAAGQTLDELVSLADDCLYFAKENGRDQVVVGPIAVAATPT